MSDGSRMSRKQPTSVWLEERPGVRRRTAGDGDGLDRQKITAAAVRLLDDEGLAKFSMRRLAAQLGVTAMSVYWYVDRKDDLLELALDAVEGELAVPDPDAADADWREQTRQVAYELRALLQRHPWTSGMLGSFLNVGPSAVAHQLAARRILTRAGLSGAQVDGALSALFSFVYGHAAVEASWAGKCEEAGISSEDCSRALRTGLGRRPEYAECAEAVRPVEQRDFGAALECVIAGIEAVRNAPPGGAAAAPGNGEGAAVTDRPSNRPVPTIPAPTAAERP